MCNASLTGSLAGKGIRLSRYGTGMGKRRPLTGWKDAMSRSLVCMEIRCRPPRSSAKKKWSSGCWRDEIQRRLLHVPEPPNHRARERRNVETHPENVSRNRPVQRTRLSYSVQYSGRLAHGKVRYSPSRQDRSGAYDVPTSRMTTTSCGLTGRLCHDIMILVFQGGCSSPSSMGG